jgi:hypothetical protein
MTVSNFIKLGMVIPVRPAQCALRETTIIFAPPWQERFSRQYYARRAGRVSAGGALTLI